MALFELLIGQRPISVQTASRGGYQAWKDYVRSEARRVWVGDLVPRGQARSSAGGLRLTLVFLCRDFPIDVDNVVKPIQDALIGVVYADDDRVTDVESHRRYLEDPIDLTRVPPLLSSALVHQIECVYVRVDEAPLLENLL